jgi:hypothetical protein
MSESKDDSIVKVDYFSLKMLKDLVSQFESVEGSNDDTKVVIILGADEENPNNYVDELFLDITFVAENSLDNGNMNLVMVLTSAKTKIIQKTMEDIKSPKIGLVELISGKRNYVTRSLGYIQSFLGR